MGVDIRTDNAIIFGLPETPENFLQEGGRPMRGSNEETKGKQGYAFFFHKGSLGGWLNRNFCTWRPLGSLVKSLLIPYDSVGGWVLLHFSSYCNWGKTNSSKKPSWFTQLIQSIFFGHFFNIFIKKRPFQILNLHQK